jgi:hypothetical protein
VNSLEKVDALSTAMLRTDDTFDGLLGLVQGVVAAEKAGFGDVNLLSGLPDEPGELDEHLLNIAGFALWLRSDDAALFDAEDLATRLPAEIGGLVQDAGFVA